MTFHTFHLVERSPWPLFGSLTAFLFMSSLMNFMHSYMDYSYYITTIFFISLIMFQWWRDITRESTFQGFHTMVVKSGLKWGMILFILSEVLFFFSFFWSFFHFSLSPDIELGMMWPPSGISPFNPFQIPLLNTVILLSSGITVTLSHHSILSKNFNMAWYSLLLTVILGIYFSFLQAFEYMEASFTISDSVFGTTFFVSTGFHGLHVLIGTSFLFTNLMRLLNSHFSSTHHFGFEAAAWYWHFVDIVWLFLYTFVYWWTF